MTERAKKLLSELISKLKDETMKISSIKEGTYSVFSDISRGKEKIKLLVYYGKKGFNTQLQGDKTSKLYKDIYETLFGIQLPLVNEEVTEPDEYIGVDESGKGDFFGPLVIAGFFVNLENKEKLSKLNIKDSKLLTDSEIKNLSKIITKEFSGYFNVVQINPQKYNELYAKINNLNKILAWGHARCIENISINHKVKYAICDQFGDTSYIKNALMKKGKELELIQTIRAEKFLAVASASILARNSFINWIENTSHELRIKIPKGSTEIALNAAKQIVKLKGTDKLKEITKTHFKTSRNLYTL